jgi:carbamoyl-phosphate synthase large subunit
VTVIVTGAGGPAGVAVIRALRARDFRVVAADTDGLAAGLRLAHEAAMLPPAGDPLYVTELAALASTTGATALACTVAEELPQLCRATDLLREAGLASWLPSPEAVATCLDQWRFLQTMHRAGIRVPDTCLGGVDRVPGPWIGCYGMLADQNETTSRVCAC